MKIKQLFLIIFTYASFDMLKGEYINFEAHKDSQWILSSSFLQTMQHFFPADYFIETGTCSGNSTICAAQIFPSVHTIEILPSLYDMACYKFRLWNSNNITAHLGSSDTIFEQILPSLGKKKCIFYLDAHYSGDGTGRGKGNTPIVREIEMISRYCEDAIIIIDDLRNFQAYDLALQVQDPAILGYPDLPTLQSLVDRMKNDYTMIIWGDAAIIYSHKYHPNIEESAVLKAMRISKFFDMLPQAHISEINVIEAEAALLHASKKEQFGIQSLIPSPKLFTPHYQLWNALVNIGNQDYIKAIDLLHEAYDNGLCHWRIKWYLAYAYYHIGNQTKAKELLEEISNNIYTISFPIGIDLCTRLHISGSQPTLG